MSINNKNNNGIKNVPIEWNFTMWQYKLIDKEFLEKIDISRRKKNVAKKELTWNSSCKLWMPFSTLLLIFEPSSIDSMLIPYSVVLLWESKFCKSNNWFYTIMYPQDIMQNLPFSRCSINIYWLMNYLGSTLQHLKSKIRTTNLKTILELIIGWINNRFTMIQKCEVVSKPNAIFGYVGIDKVQIRD